MAVTSVMVPVRISPDLKALVDQEAIKLGISQNEVMKRAIERCLIKPSKAVPVSIKDFVEKEDEEEENVWKAEVDGVVITVWRDDFALEDVGTQWLMHFREGDETEPVTLPPSEDCEPNWYEVIKEASYYMKSRIKTSLDRS